MRSFPPGERRRVALNHHEPLVPREDAGSDTDREIIGELVQPPDPGMGIEDDHDSFQRLLTGENRSPA